MPNNPPEPTASYCSRKADEIISGEKTRALIIENVSGPENKPKTLDELWRNVVILNSIQTATFGTVIVTYMLVGCDNKYLLKAFFEYNSQQLDKLRGLYNKK